MGKVIPAQTQLDFSILANSSMDYLQAKVLTNISVRQSTVVTIKGCKTLQATLASKSY